MAFKDQNARREYQKRWRAENPDKVKATAAKFRAANRPKLRAKNKTWRDKNKSRRKEQQKQYYASNSTWIRVRQRKTELKTKYGLTADQFDSMLLLQGGLCPGCGETLSAPCVDHCHTTGKIRGLLCNLCNLALGNAKDNCKTLRGLIAYLEKHLTSVESVV